MPVIGRLDPQVEDVLITPASRRRPAEPENPRPPRRAEDEPEAAPARDERREDDHARAELPVWLL